jgi:hypothetical protein
MTVPKKDERPPGRGRDGRCGHGSMGAKIRAVSTLAPAGHGSTAEQLRDMRCQTWSAHRLAAHDRRPRAVGLQCPNCAQPASKDRAGFHGADVSTPGKRTTGSTPGAEAAARFVLMASLWWL